MINRDEGLYWLICISISYESDCHLASKQGTVCPYFHFQGKLNFGRVMVEKKNRLVGSG